MDVFPALHIAAWPDPLDPDLYHDLLRSVEVQNVWPNMGYI
jgi:hypothetical protein